MITIARLPPTGMRTTRIPTAHKYPALPITRQLLLIVAYPLFSEISSPAHRVLLVTLGGPGYSVRLLRTNVLEHDEAAGIVYSGEYDRLVPTTMHPM